MAITNVAGWHGKAFRPDTSGGCVNMGQALLGTDAMFRGPIASFGFGFRAITGTGGSVAHQARCGIGDLGDSGLPNRLWIQVEKNDPNQIISAYVQTTTCGLDLIATETIALDTNKHACGLTYVEGGDYHFYVDGVDQATGAVPCADFGEGAVAGTRFVIWGSISPGIPVYDVDDDWFSDELAPAAQFLQYFNVGLP